MNLVLTINSVNHLKKVIPSMEMSLIETNQNPSHALQ